MKTYTIIFALSLLLLFSVSPYHTAAAPLGPEEFAPGEDNSPVPDTGDIVPCDGVRIQCTFNDLFILVENIIKFLVTYLAAPIAAIMFVWAGILYVTDGGSGGKVTTAKKIFTNTLIGLFLVLAAFLIVKAVVLGLTTGSGSSSSKEGLRNYFQSRQ